MNDHINKKQILFYIGLAFISAGIILNEWFLTALFSSDGVLKSSNRNIIWIFDVLLIAIGLLVIKYRAYGNFREIAYSAGIFLLFLIFMEGGLRQYHSKTPNNSIKIADIGWMTVPNTAFERQTKEYGNIQYSTGQWGFRSFGDIETTNIKILVIGNSYTVGNTVSDGDMYYDYLKNNIDNTEIFAYGGSGYSSLQEYLVLDKYFDQIQPDIILWQFGSDDIFRNNYILGTSRFHDNSRGERPYLINGQIKQSNLEENNNLVNTISQTSYLFRYMFARYDVLKTTLLGSVKDELTLTHPLVEKAIESTTDIMGLVRKRTGTVPIVAFSVDKKEWVGKAFRDICLKKDILYLGSIPNAIQSVKESGVRVDGTPNDTHWNDVGHSIAGGKLLTFLKQNELLNKKALAQVNAKIENR